MQPSVKARSPPAASWGRLTEPLCRWGSGERRDWSHGHKLNWVSHILRLLVEVFIHMSSNEILPHFYQLFHELFWALQATCALGL